MLQILTDILKVILLLLVIQQDFFPMQKLCTLLYLAQQIRDDVSLCYISLHPSMLQRSILATLLFAA